MPEAVVSIEGFTNYEKKKTDPERSACLGAYYRRWRGWVRGGLSPDWNNQPCELDYPSLVFLLDRRRNATMVRPNMVMTSP